MSPTKATLEFRILQGQDAANASLEEWCDLALNVDHFFEADLCNAFDSDVDVGQSCDSDISSEVQDHDNYQDSIGEHHEVYEMQNDLQQNYIVDSDAEYTNDSNIILYEQYEEENAEQVV
ncbi:hypothetical protein Tco_0685673 [Tanacetum coccineum]